MAAELLDRYQHASDETRRLIDRLLTQDADDQAWADQLGPAYRQADVAKLLGKSKQAVSRDRRLLRLTTRSEQIAYPAFQFDGRRPLPGIAEVITILDGTVATTWTIASWLTAPQPALDGDRPVDRLRAGDRDGVLTLARQAAAALAA